MRLITSFRQPGVQIVALLTIIIFTPHSADAQVWSESKTIKHGIIIEASLYAKGGGGWELRGSGRKGNCIIPITRTLTGNDDWRVKKSCDVAKIKARFIVSRWKGGNDWVSFTLTGSGEAKDLLFKGRLGGANAQFIVNGTDHAAINRRNEQARKLAEQQRRERELEEQRRREQEANNQTANLPVPSQGSISSTGSSSSRSINGNTPVNVVFENRTGRQVEVYWVDYQGKEILYSRLADGRQLTQGTYSTHPWRFRNGGQLLGEYVATGQSQQFFQIPGSGNIANVNKVVQRLPPAGNMAGAGFSDECLDPVEVHVRSGWWIDGVQLLCRNSTGRLHHFNHRGGLGGNGYVFKLQPGEKIVAISGTTHGDAGAYVYSIQIHTNQRSSPRYGEGGPQRGRRNFEFKVPPGGQFAGLHGAADAYLNAIGMLIR